MRTLIYIVLALAITGHVLAYAKRNINLHSVSATINCNHVDCNELNLKG